MSRSLGRLIEQQIAKATLEGQLTGVNGECKPLPDRSGEATRNATTANAMRIAAEARAYPEECKCRTVLDAARATNAEASSEGEKRVGMALIAELELRYIITGEARLAFLKL